VRLAAAAQSQSIGLARRPARPGPARPVHSSAGAYISLLACSAHRIIVVVVVVVVFVSRTY